LKKPWGRKIAQDERSIVLTPPTKSEDSIVKGLCFSGFGTEGYVVRVDVREGKIIRIRPLHYDWKYQPEELESWQIEARKAG
jgi:hypothetical protein